MSGEPGGPLAAELQDKRVVSWGWKGEGGVEASVLSVIPCRGEEAGRRNKLEKKKKKRSQPRRSPGMPGSGFFGPEVMNLNNLQRTLARAASLELT